MAITGEKFLQLEGITNFIIMDHAKSKIRLKLNMYRKISEEEMLHLFKNARQISFEELHFKGFRSRHFGRKSKGQNSWYFVFKLFNEEMVAVISKKENKPDLMWVTTFTHNSQSEMLKA